MPEREVAVLAGGLSHERDVSLRSGRRLTAALRQQGHTVHEWDTDGSLLDRLRRTPPDAVLVALHGGQGEDGSVQSLLELAGIPFLGTDAASCRRAWDKPTAKTVLSEKGVHTPRWCVLPQRTFRELGAQRLLDQVVETMGLPLLLKPAQGGSALGAVAVHDPAELPAAMVSCLSYGDPVMVESYAAGTEVAVTVVDSGSVPQALPAVEIEVPGGIYDFDARYVAGSTTFHTPARLSEARTAAVTEVAVTTHRELNLRDISRMDAIVASDGTVQFLEVNVSPGLTETSLTPMSIETSGSSVGQVYSELIERAINRFR